MSGGSSAVAPSLSQSLAYALFTALAYPVLTMFGVTLLSLTTGSSPPSEGRPQRISAPNVRRSGRGERAKDDLRSARPAQPVG
jgi:hypothetical protein